MKNLIVFYSLEGNTRFVAECIAEAANADLLELKPKKEISPNGFSRFFWGGKQVFFKEKPELNPFDKNPNDYDVVFFGTPVWAGNFAPVFNSFFSEMSIKDKKVALFACYGGGAGKTFDNFSKALVGNNVVSQIGFKDPLGNDKEAAKKKIEEWVKDILKE